MNKQQSNELRVSGSSSTNVLAGSIMHCMREHSSARLVAIGAAAVNQMVKAVAVATSMTAEEGRSLHVQVAFRDVVTPSGDHFSALEMTATSKA